MADADDFMTGECGICGGNDFDICLISLSPFDMGILECEHGHLICFKCAEKIGLEKEFGPGLEGYEGNMDKNLCPICQELKQHKEFQVQIILRQKRDGKYGAIAGQQDIVLFETDDLEEAKTKITEVKMR